VCRGGPEVSREGAIVRRAPLAEARRIQAFDVRDEREDVQSEEDQQAHRDALDRAVAKNTWGRGREREEDDHVERQVVGR
jgi:hypothetical protein